MGPHFRSRRTSARLACVFGVVACTLSCGTPSSQPTTAPSSVPTTTTTSTTQTPATPAAPQPPQTFVGAGDIAECATPGELTGAQATAALLDGIPGTVFTAGDNVNDVPSTANGLLVNGQDQRFLKCYEPTWGRHKARTKPAPGNHDNQVSWDAYFNYFGAAAAPPQGYYSFDVGAWHVLSLNSEINMAPMLTWIDSDLAARTPSSCTLAIIHRPAFSSYPPCAGGDILPVFDKLQKAGVSLLISGHCHMYERFAPIDTSVGYSPSGMVQVVVGTGGAFFHTPGPPRPNSVTIIPNQNGVLKLTLRSDGYDAAFVTAKGVLDSFSGTCGPITQANTLKRQGVRR
jgi:acid phosphatase type 7